MMISNRLSQQKSLYKSHKNDRRSSNHEVSRKEKDRDRKYRDESTKRHRSDNSTRHNITEEHYKSKREKELRHSRARHDERIRRRRESSETRRRPRSIIFEEMEKMLDIEDHHVIWISTSDMAKVEWCPKFIKPDIRGHVRGGKDLLHHRCRVCRRLCLHLLGRPGTKRQCLECSGKFDRNDIPEWYYHKGCKYC